MNIDERPYNKGAKHTRYHVTMPQDARHKLKGAKVFSEFDTGNGFNQVPLHTDSRRRPTTLSTASIIRRTSHTRR